MMDRTTIPVTTPAMSGVLDFEVLELAVCVGDEVAWSVVDTVNVEVDAARPALLSSEFVVTAWMFEVETEEDVVELEDETVDE